MSKLSIRTRGFSVQSFHGFLLAAFSAVLASCGGGGGGSGPTAPSISTQPQNITVNDGQTATFSVTATGTAPLTYEWRKNGTAISGATGLSYTTPALQLSDSGTEFTVVVSNVAGSKTSSAATLTVNPIAPAITAQPADATASEGQAVMFSVSASGSAPLTYQWKRGGTAIDGATGASYTLPAAALSDSGAQFTVTVSNGGGNATSNAATLTVNAVAPAITAPPADVTVSAGQPAMFSVAASGSAPLSYQWKLRGVDITGATGSTYTLASPGISDSGGSFTVVVSNVAGTVTSPAALLTVLPIAPSITSPPLSLSVPDGGTATFSVGASGTAPLTYQWRKNGANIGGATTSVYTTPVVHVADSGAAYSVAISNPTNTIVVSASATLTVTPVPPTITTQPQSRTVADGATATFSVAASGTAPFTYQWRKNGSNIAGATAATYTTPAVTTADNGALFDVVVSNAATPAATSAAATLTVNSVAPTIAAQPQSQTIAAPATATFTVVAGGTAPFTYQWRRNGTDIVGATGASYTTAATTAADSGAVFTVVVSNGVNPAATSSAATLTVTHTLSLLAGKLGGAGHADGTGSAATFYSPVGLTTDSAGNIYLSDQFNQLIRMVTPAGVVTTIAGTPGIAGSANGTGAAALFNKPGQVAVDASGNIYVADSGNHVIRMISSGGVVTTIAGTAGSSGNANGTGAGARFNSPSGIAVYQAAIPGPVTLIVADTGNNTIRAIDSSFVVTTLAGSGSGSIGSADGTGSAAQFNYPQGLAVDQTTGTVYVADFFNSTVRQVTSAGVVTTLAGTAGQFGSTNGVGASARFLSPSAVALDSTNGILYVADQGNQTIRQIALSGAVVSTFAGTAGLIGTADGTGSAARFSTPIGVAIGTTGILYVADNINNLIRQISTPGAVVTTLAGNIGGRGFADGTGGAARFNNPHFVASHASGTLYVADHLNNLIRKISAGGVVTTISGPFNAPYGVATDPTDPTGATLYVADTNNNLIRKIVGTTVTTFAGSTTAGFADGTGVGAKFSHPVAVATDASGNVYVGDFDNNAIRMIDSSGLVTTIAGAPPPTAISGSANGTGTAARFNGPRGLIVDQVTGTIFVTDRNNATVRKITMPGAVVTTYAGTAGAVGFADGNTGPAARFNWPNGPGLDAAGNLYVTDSNNHAIRKITPAGFVTTIVGAQPGTPLSYSVILGSLPGSLDGPSSLAVIPGTPVQLVITDATENSVLIAVLP